MDMAALCPRWINIRRGCYILVVIAVAVCLWNSVNSAPTFITVLGGWSVFLSQMTGILIGDDVVVRNANLHVGDLYRSKGSSMYRYTGGVNRRHSRLGSWACGPCYI